MRRGNAATNGTRFSSVGQDDSVSSSKLHPHHAATKKTAALTVMFHPRALLLLLLVLLLSVYVILSKNPIFCLGFWPKADAKLRTIFCSHKLFGIFFAKERNIFAYFDKHQGKRGETLYKLLRRRNGRRTAASIEERGR
jgi:hypothetical protein